MTLDRFRPLADRVLDPMAGVADRLGMTPNTVSVIAFVVAVVAAGCFYLAPDRRWLYAAGGLHIGLNGWRGR
jgi:archaetidylinositol phosphate synthase